MTRLGRPGVYAVCRVAAGEGDADAGIGDAVELDKLGDDRFELVPGMVDGEAHVGGGMVEAIEVVVEENGFCGDGLEVVENSVAALDGEVVYVEGGVGGGEEGIVEECVHDRIYEIRGETD